jgi:hypothetical protein
MAALHTHHYIKNADTNTYISVPHDHSHGQHTPHNKVRIKLTILIFQHKTYITHPIVTKIHISQNPQEKKHR